jgi:hypothetical protein
VSAASTKSTRALVFVNTHVTVTSLSAVDPRNMTYAHAWKIPMLPSVSVRLRHGAYQKGWTDNWTYAGGVVRGRVGDADVKVAVITRYNAAMSQQFLMVFRVIKSVLYVAWVPTASPDNPYGATLRIAKRRLSAHWPSCQNIANCTDNPAVTVRYSIVHNRLVKMS